MSRIALTFFYAISLPYLSTATFSSSVHIWQKLLLNYDNTDLPTNGPILVDVEITIEDIPNISQGDGSFDVDIRFTQIWNDPNLNFMHIDSKRPNITLDYSILNSLWTPNVCFVNSKHSRIHISPAPNILLLISPNGSVWYSCRIRVEGPCEMMSKTHFPMDVQTCSLVFESYSYNSAEVQLKWLTQNAIKLVGEYAIPEFILVDVKSEKNQLVYKAGTWVQLVVRFTFKRKLGYYMLQAYLPTHVCVAVSWVSFYLDTTATPARATVGVSTLMALLLAYGNIASGLPRVSYLRALDIWMGACMLLTFFTLLEFAVVGFIEKRREKLISREKRLRCSFRSEKSSKSANQAQDSRHTKVNTLGSKIDSISAKVFPAVFLIFNAFYWTYYLYCYFVL